MANPKKNNTNSVHHELRHQHLFPSIPSLRAPTSKPGGAFAFGTNGNGNGSIDTSHDINGRSFPPSLTKPLNINAIEDSNLPGIALLDTGLKPCPNTTNVFTPISFQAPLQRQSDIAEQAPAPTMAYDGPTFPSATFGNSLRSVFGSSQNQYCSGSSSSSGSSSNALGMTTTTIPGVLVEDPKGGLRIVQMETPESFGNSLSSRDTIVQRRKARKNPTNGVKQNQTPLKTTPLATKLARIDPAVLQSFTHSQRVENGVEGVTKPSITKSKNPFRGTKVVPSMESQAKRYGPTNIDEVFSPTFQNISSPSTDVPSYSHYSPREYNVPSPRAQLSDSNIHKPTQPGLTPVMSPIPVRRLGLETILPQQRDCPLTMTTSPPPRTETTNSSAYRSTPEKHNILFGERKLPLPSPGRSPAQAYNFQQWGGGLSPQTATSCSSIYRATPSPGANVAKEVVELVCFTPPYCAGIDGYGPYNVKLPPIGGNATTIPQISELIIPEEDLDLTYVYRPVVWYSCAKDILKCHVPPSLDYDIHDQARKSRQISLPADTQVNYVDRYQWNNVMVQVYAITASYKTVKTMDENREPTVLKPYSGCAVIWGPDIKTSRTSACFPLLEEDDAGCALLRAVKAALGAMDWKEMGYKQVTILTDDVRLWSFVMHHGRLGMIGGREGQVLRELWGMIVEMEKVGGVRVRFWKVDAEDLKGVSGLAEMAVLPKSAVKDWVEILGDGRYEVDGDRWRWRRGDGGWENLGKKQAPVVMDTTGSEMVTEEVVMGKHQEKEVTKDKGKGREVPRNFYYHSNETMAASMEERWGIPNDDIPRMDLNGSGSTAGTKWNGASSNGRASNTGGVSSNDTTSNANGTSSSDTMATVSNWTPLNGTGPKPALNGGSKPWVGSAMRDGGVDSFLGRLRKQVGEDILGEGRTGNMNGNTNGNTNGNLKGKATLL
ncbi:hypothetical protein TWF694_006841 [Orbilia ellipsospora]|uniref:RNase H type-1 domain-containing protein n=1 Tax=Orbilia ellipsospora TaxID=2528407 RepID=A0AAV9XPS9_9PEZI